MFRRALILVAVLAAAPAFAAEPSGVPPGHYRIRVDYDEHTLEKVRREIRAELASAAVARKHRLKLSRAEVTRRLKEETARAEARLEAVRRAQAPGEAALRRGDVSEADKWRIIAADREREAFSSATRLRLIEEALLRMSIEKWRLTRKQERRVAESTLRELRRLLDAIRAKEAAERRERGAAVVPPHE